MKILPLIILFFFPALSFAQRLGMSFALSHNLQLSQRQELKLELTHKLILSLQPRMTLELKQKYETEINNAYNIIKKNLEQWLDHGVLVKKRLILADKIDPIDYYAFSKISLSKSKYSSPTTLAMVDQLAAVLRQVENFGLMLSFSDLGIFINEDLIPSKYTPFAIMHGHATSLFSNNFHGNVVEFIYAKKQGKLAEYLEWLRTTPAYIPKMENFFQHYNEEPGQLPDHRLGDMSERTKWILKNILAFEGDEDSDDWVAKIPMEVVNEIKRVGKILSQFDKIIDQFFKLASKKIKAILPRKGSLKSQVDPILVDFEKFFIEMQEVYKGGPVHSESLNGNLKNYSVQLSSEYAEKLNQLQEILGRTNYQTWLFTEYFDFDNSPLMSLSLQNIFPQISAKASGPHGLEKNRRSTGKKIKSILTLLQEFAKKAEKALNNLHPWQGPQKMQLEAIQDDYVHLTKLVASSLANNHLSAENMSAELARWKNIQLQLEHQYATAISNLFSRPSIQADVEHWLAEEESIPLAQLQFMSNELSDLLSDPTNAKSHLRSTCYQLAATALKF